MQRFTIDLNQCPAELRAGLGDIIALYPDRFAGGTPLAFAPEPACGGLRVEGGGDGLRVAYGRKIDAFRASSSNFIARFETFGAGSNTFMNVTVLSTNRTDIFLRHAGGIVNVKVKDVDPEILKQLGYKVAETESKTGRNALGPISNQMMTNLTQKLEENQQFKALASRWQAQMVPQLPPISKGLIAGVLGAFLAVYLFFSFCCRLIVKKTGNQPGILVWLPILKMLPLIRAAGMPGWWFLLWLVPGINIIPAVM